MTEPALRLVTNDGEVVEPADAQEWRERYDAACERLAQKQIEIDALAARLQKKDFRVRELEGEYGDRAVKDPLQADIRDVLLYQRQEMMTDRAGITPDSDGWRKVRDRLSDLDVATGKPLFTVALLCESVDGAKKDDWYFKGHSRNRPESVFRNASVVQRNLERHRRLLGQARYDLFDLPAPAHVVEWLAEECSCGHVRCQHAVRTNGGCCAVVDGRICGCEKLVTTTDRIARWREAQCSSRGEQ